MYQRSIQSKEKRKYRYHVPCSHPCSTSPNEGSRVQVVSSRTVLSENSVKQTEEVKQNSGTQEPNRGLVFTELVCKFASSARRQMHCNSHVWEVEPVEVSGGSYLLKRPSNGFLPATTGPERAGGTPIGSCLMSGPYFKWRQDHAACL